MVTLYLEHHFKGYLSTFGVISDGSANNKWFTLEPSPVIIPKGRYLVTWTFSPKFNRRMPLINDVKGHSAVRIHAGNSYCDTDGCILVGTKITNKDFLENSRVALSELFKFVKESNFYLCVCD